MGLGLDVRSELRGYREGAEASWSGRRWFFLGLGIFITFVLRLRLLGHNLRLFLWLGGIFMMGMPVGRLFSQLRARRWFGKPERLEQNAAVFVFILLFLVNRMGDGRGGFM